MRTNYPQLHEDVAFGRAKGKIIWQPRIGCWYDDKIFASGTLPEPYSGMDIYQVYEAIDCSARLYDYNSCFYRIEHPQTSITSRSLNETDTQWTIQTPVGKQTAIGRKSFNSPHQITAKWEIETEEDFKVARWREENCDWGWNEEQFQKLNHKIGHLGAPTMFMPRMNVQALYIEKMGVENAVYAIFEKPEIVESYFRALEENQSLLINVINSSPLNIINFGDNVHAGTLSPPFFEKYHLPECQRRCEKLHSAGKFVCSHWDGDTKPLLRYAHETGLDGIEAITPIPQGDVTLKEVKAALGDDMFLLDGIPAIYFDEMFPVEKLIDCVHQIIDLFAPHLILGISDEISSSGDLERVKIVRDIVDKYNSEIDSKES